MLLAVLFMYKALSELSLDPLWGIIYGLIGADYLLELRSGDEHEDRR